MTERIERAVVVGLVSSVIMFAAGNSWALDVRTVVISGNQVAVGTGAGPFTPVTQDAASKTLPLWSKDGTRISYIEKDNDPLTLAKLVVIDASGRFQSSAAIKPIVSGEVRSGMRFVESVQWLSPYRVVVAGSVNPSTTEYDVIDLSNGTTIDEIYDDGAGASFSPDGLHAAYVTGAPHFAAPDQNVPTLNIDGSPVQNKSDGRVDFAASPVWSANSSQVAVVVLDRERHEYGVMIARIPETQGSAVTASIVPLPFQGGAPETAYWVGNLLYVSRRVPNLHPQTAVLGQRQFKSETYVFRQGSPDAPWSHVRSNLVPNDPAEEAKTLRDNLSTAAGIRGATQYDFWCSRCALANVPRKTSLGGQ